MRWSERELLARLNRPTLGFQCRAEVHWIRSDGWPPKCGRAHLSAGLDSDPRLHRDPKNRAECCGWSTSAQRILAAPWPPGARESRMSAEQCLRCWTFFSSNGCGVEAPLPWAYLVSGPGSLQRQ